MPPDLVKYAPKTRQTTAMNFMRVLMLGPDESFSGSPTMSLTSELMWGSDFGSWTCSSIVSSWHSMHFLALFQSAPELTDYVDN
jgi:hypothetical protein